MKTVPIVILGLIATVGAVSQTRGLHSRHGPGRMVGASRGQVVTTVESVIRHGTYSLLILRKAELQLVSVKVTGATVMTTRDGKRIGPRELRSGDRLELEADGSMRDVSENTALLSGVVSTAPVSEPDVMIVQVTPSRTVLVNVAAHTIFTDDTGRRSSPAELVESDTVSVRGIINTTMDEVVEAQSIEQVGPRVTRTYSIG